MLPIIRIEIKQITANILHSRKTAGTGGNILKKLEGDKR
jgi:hypothetical protein